MVTGYCKSQTVPSLPIKISIASLFLTDYLKKKTALRVPTQQEHGTDR